MRYWANDIEVSNSSRIAAWSHVSRMRTWPLLGKGATTLLSTGRSGVPEYGAKRLPVSADQKMIVDTR
jgi:hypothetical protein